MTKKSEIKQGDPETTGHEWDGLQEFNNPLPRWWLWTFYATIAWGVVYTILYPAWPLVNSATAGILGWSSRADVAAEIVAAEEANAAINDRLASVELAAITTDDELRRYAESAGKAVFNTFCAQCHGREGGLGAAGYPVLSDDVWLWGGDMDSIYFTIAHGIRNTESDEARYSEMPAFGRDELLEPEQIDAVVNYVMSLSGTPQDASLAEAGAEVYADSCAACHGDRAEGDRDQGAPGLSDAIWLYGGDYDTLTETVVNGRFGVMPSWNTRLTEAELRAVTAYVHQLGGGE